MNAVNKVPLGSSERATFFIAAWIAEVNSPLPGFKGAM